MVKMALTEDLTQKTHTFGECTLRFLLHIMVNLKQRSRVNHHKRRSCNPIVSAAMF